MAFADPRIQQQLNEYGYQHCDDRYVYLGAANFGIYCNKQEIKINNLPLLVSAAFKSVHQYPEPARLTALQHAINRPFVTSIISNKAARRASFANWPLVSPNREQMIKAGFIYLGVGDRTRTFCCDFYVQNWATTDDPTEIHLFRNPSCINVQKVMSEHSETKRAATFIDWPLTEPSVDEIIKAGFVYTGLGDKTRTFCCDLTVQGWKKTDDPVKIHHSRSPNCRQSLIIMANQDERKTVTFSLTPEDFHLRVTPGPPREIRYNSYKSRFLSFSTWPIIVKVSIAEMARAGFYYEGQLDFVKCFHCNGGCMQWFDGEDPFRRHARMYPGCTYVLYVKGTEFVNQAGAAPQILAKQERDKMHADLKCKICLESIAAVCFVPCFHLGSCNSCARREKFCPFCRQIYNGILPANLE
jgi:hypothetical protein